MVHRDLKPANILLALRGQNNEDGFTTKILDFGISKISGSDTINTREDILLGTPQYMAPEQALGHHSEIDQRADIFSLGAMAYEMLTGQRAFGGKKIPEVLYQIVHCNPKPVTDYFAGCPKNVAHALNMAMQKNPSDRFHSVDDFFHALVDDSFEDSFATCGIERKPLSASIPSLNKEQTSNHRDQTEDLSNDFYDIFTKDEDDNKRPTRSFKLMLFASAIVLVLGAIGYQRIKKEPATSMSSENVSSPAKTDFQGEIELENKLTPKQQTLFKNAQKDAKNRKKQKTKRAVKKLLSSPETISHGRFVEGLLFCSTKNDDYNKHLKQMSPQHKRSLLTHCNNVWSDRKK